MSEKPAVEGGTPVRLVQLPLVRACYGLEELQEVVSVFQEGVFCSVDPTARKVKALEKAFAEFVGVKHAVAFSSGTTAQHASLAAIEIEPGDEVIVPPLTFISTAYTVLIQGGTVVFADVDPGTFNLDPARVREKITPRTRAVIPVHWFGHPVDMDPLLELAQEHNLTVIEDCAHAYGGAYRSRPVGTMGAMTCWSFQASKVITTAGEGGMLTTNDDRLAERARMIRDHGKSQARESAQPGWVPAYQVVVVGNNYRMTEIQAGFGLAQLRKLDTFRTQRKAHTEYLDAALLDVPGLSRQAVRPDVTLSYAYYPVRFQTGHFRVSIDQISLSLRAEGIGNYPIAKEELCHVHPIFTSRSGQNGQRYGPGTLPVAEQIARELLILPMYPDLTRQDLDDVISAVRKAAAYAV